MPDFPPPKPPRLSLLVIDVSKDWLGYRIENLGAPTAVGHALRRGDESLINHNALLNYVAAQHLSLPDTIASVLTDHDLARHPLSIIPTMDLDHVPASVILERIQTQRGVFWFNNNWLPSGMINNGQSGTGSITWASSYLRLATGTTSGSYAYVYKSAMGLMAARWDKKTFFGIRVMFYAYSNQNIHIVNGELSGYTQASNIERHIGFKLIGANLYGTVGNNVAESTLLLETLTAGYQARILECVLEPGVECRFYVDGVDKGAITDNLPSGSADAEYLLNASVHNTEAVNKQLSIYCFMSYREE